MKRLLIVAAVAAVAAPAFAAPELLPIRGMNYGTYDQASSTFTPGHQTTRYGDPVWWSIERSGYYTSITDDGWSVLDWGDIAGPQAIGGFQFSYATAEMMPTLINCYMLFFAEENGFNSLDRVYLAGFNVIDLPTGGPTWNGWTVTVDLEGSGSEFIIDGSDIDFDGLVDFGYVYAFPLEWELTGPTVAGDPNTESDGMEDAFDSFIYVDANDLISEYVGSWYWPDPLPDGSHLYAQFYMQLYDGNVPDGCPNPGDSGRYCTADIAGDVCVVDLADLAQLLSNYGVTSGAVHDDGDVEPADGDGDVDLSDLAELLAQYNDDCRE